ncbi:MAG: thioesterase, partial [Pseudomonadota bacterium]
TVTVEAECIALRGPQARFRLRAHDGVDEIGRGTHDRFILTWKRFERGLAPKLDKSRMEAPA